MLGARLAELRPPAREITLFGIKVGSGPDLRHVCNVSRSLRSALYVLGHLVRHALDVALHGRDLLLMSGNALVARLAKTAIDLDIPIWLDASACELIFEGRRVTGARLRRNAGAVSVIARHGVILAAGGFPHDPPRRRRLYAPAPAPDKHYSLAAPGNTGDGLNLAESAGGQIDPDCNNAAAWMPVSRVRYRDGGFGTYPHGFERGKPGVIRVNKAGARFTNESDSHHDVVRAMIAVRSAGEPVTAFLVCDTRFIRRYGLGMAKPFPLPLGPYLRSGYLLRGETIENLAAKTGINAAALGDTVANFNAAAASGNDPAFHRGENAYNRDLGDANHGPNPCLAPIIEPPYYAVRVLPGDLGTLQGLRTDSHARVIDRDGQATAGLYAVGSDMASIFAGNYPEPGANLGPAMTFGFLCAQHIAQTGGLTGKSGGGDK